MLQKQKMSPPMHAQVATPAPTLPGTLGPVQHSRVVQSLQHVIGFPDSWTSFLMFLIILLVLSGGLLLHIHLSAQILQIQLQIDELERAYNEIEYQNAEIIWQLSQSTAIDDVQQRALALGYESTQHHYYVTVPNTERTDSASAQGIQLRQNAAYAVKGSDSASLSSLAANPTLIGREASWHSHLQGMDSWIHRWWLR